MSIFGGSFQSKIVLFKDCGFLPAQKRRNSTMAVPSASAGFARTRFATWSQNVRYGFLRSIRSIAIEKLRLRICDFCYLKTRDVPFAGTMSDPKIDSAGGYLNQWEESAGNDHKRRDNRIIITVSSKQPVVRVLPNNSSSNSEWIIQTMSGSLPN